MIYWRFVLCLSFPIKSRHAQVCSRSSEAKRVRAQRQHKSATSFDCSRSTSPCCSRATLEGSSCSWSSLAGAVQLPLAWWRPSARRWHSTWVWQKSTQGQGDRSITTKIKLVLWMTMTTLNLQRSRTLGIFLEEALALELIHDDGYHHLRGYYKRWSCSTLQRTHHARRRHANPTEDNHGDALPRSNLWLSDLLALCTLQHDPWKTKLV